MPEGHTLFRLARQQDELFVGREVHVSSPQGRFTAGAEAVDGRVLDEVTSYGKHLFARFGGDVVHVHLGLYGKFTTGTGTAPEPRGALRMRWEATGPDGAGVWTDLRGATACELLTDPEVDAILYRLGPDPLRKSDPRKAYARIAKSRVTIGALLMDQAVLAGVGNVYRAEVLFRAGISPFRPGRDITPEEWTALWRDLVTVMRAGVKAGRIVTTRAEHRPRRKGGLRREDASYVYRRTGLPCRVCGTEVRTEVMVGRNLFWCPTCQAV
ncbi:Fpg/Nei family DNA glycosylase [Modestobacter sp. I12A-02628]|uniref:DNA-(apurinic or apyrimidinic site) lyase n=1 Tax=Goekera deserti TaxID=2497753 RepID=A0A7K3WJC5_9ACTN|nr:Fpg/Nei family DNA glycosylase [Goekera deserti]MPQ99348.1 Fpg/Nei family DNA glycosylase [Goekera deserti]NDI50347.1 Fpg/Nei family DNA glycosylase [Goekera deserti]NEL56402.1 Fpg/Nei family DNA glycosylase [Goekera deserti]